MPEKINSEISALKKETKEYVKIQTDIAKLHITGELSRLMSDFMLKAYILFFLFFVLLLFSAAAALFIGKMMQSYIYGLLIVGGFYLLVAFIVWLSRKPLFEKPLIRWFINLMYPNTGDDEK